VPIVHRWEDIRSDPDSAQDSQRTRQKLAAYGGLVRLGHKSRAETASYSSVAGRSSPLAKLQISNKKRKTALSTYATGWETDKR
jgi:hypothetical protein